MSLEFLVMGPVEVRRDGQEIPLGGPQQRRLLSVLLSVPGQALSADRIEEAMWPGGDAPEGARRALHTYVSRLRAAVGDGAVVTRPEGYLVDIGSDDLDSAAFERLLDTARAAAPTHRVALLDEALALWRGPAFGEFGGEWWARPIAARLEELRLTAIEERIAMLVELGDPERAVSDAEGFAAAYPLRERPVELMARALVASGRQVDALRVLRDFHARLVDRTGLDPSPSLVELERAIVEGAPTGGPRGNRSARGYVLGEVLGEGSFGTVFRATQPGVGREVAVKVIRAELANDPQFVQRFEVEAQLVARLEHPHIVPLYDFWREPGGAFLVFRLMRGGSAEQSLITDGAWPLERVSKLVDQIGGALSVAHAAGVVHRDIKPANVLFDESGNAHLADFGIASTNDAPGAPDHSVGPYSAGSPLYASPEQFQHLAVSSRSDIYSFAALVWELLAGRPPHEAESLSMLGRIKLERPAPSLATIRPDIAATIDPVLQKATAPDPANRFASASEFVLAWLAGLESRRSATTQSSISRSPRQRAAETLTELAVAGANPYKGLRAFTEADARDFFGRSALVDDLVDAVERGRVTMVVGASGSGKTSLLHAGLVPRLRASGARIVTLVPTDRPCEQLRAALLNVAIAPLDLTLERAIDHVAGEAPSDLVLVVDQLEEVWTLVSDEAERERFVGLLARVIATGAANVRCVFGIRADFFDRPLGEPELGPLVARHIFTVTPMSAAELSEAVRAPANAVGVGFEPGLDAEIVADVANQTAVLPLLQFALAELYEKRRRSVIPTDAYREMGGVIGAVAARAEAVYAGLDADAKEDTRRLLGRLVTPGAGVEDTRRRVKRSALPASLNDLADVFVAHRLLVVDRDPASREPTLDIAHEALISRWPRLRGWLEEDRERLQQLQHLSRAADEWQAGGRRATDLYRDPRLAMIGEIDGASTTVFTPIEQQFVDASRQARDATARVERDRVELQALQNRRLRRSLVAAGVALVIALVAGAVALQQRSTANDNAAAAETNERRASESFVDAELRRVALEARTIAPGQPDLGMLLAAEAAQRRPGAETDSALLATLQANPVITRVIDIGLPDDKRIWDIAGSPPGPIVATNESTAVLIDGTTLLPSGTRWDLDAISNVAVSPDGSQAVTASREGTIARHDLATGEQVGEVVRVAAGAFLGGAVPVAFLFDGSIAVADGASLHFYVPSSPDPVRTIRFEEAVGLLEASPDGRRLVVGGFRDLPGQLLDVEQGTAVDLGRGQLHAAAFGEDDRLFVAVLRDKVTILEMYDAASATLTQGTLVSAFGTPAYRIVPLATGDILYENTLYEIHQYDEALSEVEDVSAASATGGTFIGVALDDGSAVSTFGGRLVVLDTAGRVLPLTWLPIVGAVFPRRFQDRFMVSTVEGAQLYDADLLEPIGPLIPGLASMFSFSGDTSPDLEYVAGRSVATGDVIVYETETGRPVGAPIVVDDGVQNGGAPRFSPDGTRLAVADSSGVAIYAMPDLTLLRHVDIAGQLALSIEWSTDAEQLTFVDITTLAHLVDVASGQVTKIDGAWNTFTEDGTQLVEFPVGEPIRLVDRSTLAIDATLPGFKELSSGVPIPGTQRIFRFTNTYVDVLDLPSASRIGEPFRLESAFGTLTSTASVSIDGTYALVGSPSDPVRRIELDRDSWLSIACDASGRNLTRAEWDRYFGAAALEYHATCPQYPAGT
jgi:serine/threonine protein kinase/DNA-binding SARP family transcriptional activator/WD40 repeat protein